MIDLIEDEYLKLEIFYYNELDTNDKIFGFISLSTLQALRHFPYDLKFNKFTIFMEDDKNSYTEKDDIFQSIITINDFINLFLHSNYHIIDFNGVVLNKIEMSSHDDGEVFITFSENVKCEEIINQIFFKNGFDYIKIIEVLKNNKDKYLKFMKPVKLIKIYNNFDEYIDSI